MNAPAKTLIPIALLGVAIFYVWPDGERENDDSALQPPTIIIDRKGPNGEEGPLDAARKKRIDELKKEIEANFPTQDDGILAGWEQAGERMAVFAELGALLGEEGVDFAFERYGDLGPPNFIWKSPYLEMTMTMTGWAEKDMDAALAAFCQFFSFKVLRDGAPPQLDIFGGIFQWKGKKFHAANF